MQSFSLYPSSGSYAHQLRASGSSHRSMISVVHVASFRNSRVVRVTSVLPGKLVPYSTSSLASLPGGDHDGEPPSGDQPAAPVWRRSLCTTNHKTTTAIKVTVTEMVRTSKLER